MGAGLPHHDVTHTHSARRAGFRPLQPRVLLASRGQCWASLNFLCEWNQAASQTSAEGWSEPTGKRRVYWDAFLQGPNFLKTLKNQISSEAAMGEENPCDDRRVDSVGSDGNKSFSQSKWG